MSTRLAYVGVQEPRNLPYLSSGTTAISIALGSQCTKTLVALTTGCRYILTGATFTLSATASLAATTVGVAVIDGASGATTYLWRGIMVLGSSGTSVLNIENRMITGSAATAMTVEFSAGLTSVTECVSFEYTKTGAYTTT